MILKALIYHKCQIDNPYSFGSIVKELKKSFVCEICFSLITNMEI
jgi:hypothetical protein